MRLQFAKIIGLIAMMQVGGCSFAFVDGPPPGRLRTLPVKCTQSQFWPSLDISGAVGTGAFGLTLSELALIPCSDCPINEFNRVALVAVGAGLLALGALYVFSASIGFDQVRYCRAAQRQVSGY